MMHILILGAGYAGLRTALDVSQRLSGREDQARITLIDRNLYHQHVIMLHLAATGGGNLTEMALPLEEILRGRAVRLYQGEVERILPLDRRVVLQDGLSMGYDRLVIALGGTTNYANIPGAREHTWPLRSYDEALQLREHIENCFREAVQTSDPAMRRRLLTFVVVGGGFTGCQLAGELERQAGTLCRQHDLSREEVRIVLLERSDALLKQFGAEWASREALQVLSRRGISVHLQTTVERVSEQAVSLGSGKRISAATIIWVAGIRAPRLLADSGLATDGQGRIPVDRYLRGTGPDQALIFAAGDCASVPDLSGRILPATASYAMRQGEHLAETLLMEVRRQPPRAYVPYNPGLLVSLGPGEAVGSPLGVPACGLPTWLLKEAVERWYLTTL